MTQPAASRLLAELEDAFGQPLFERGRFGLKPLPAAAEVLRFAKVMQAEEQLLAEALHGARVPAPVRVGCLPSIPAFVVDAIRAFKRQHEATRVALGEGTLHALLPLLLEGELDFVVGRFEPLLMSETLAYEGLWDEGLSVVGSPDHPLAGKRRVSAKELCTYPWVVPPRASSLYPHFASLFAELPMPSDVIECAAPLAVQAFIGDGRTLGLMSASLPRRLLRQHIRALDVQVPPAPSPLGIYRVAGRPLSAQTEVMIDQLRTVAGKLRTTAPRRAAVSSGTGK